MNRTQTLVGRTALALIAALAAACGTAGSNGGGGNPDLITREQVLSMPDGTAQTVIQRLRSGWLRPRPGSFSGQPDLPVVYLNEMRFGGIDSLSRIPSTNIESIQYMNATDATTRYGTGYAGGLIRVNTFGR
jgi:hypothetical protein